MSSDFAKIKKISDDRRLENGEVLLDVNKVNEIVSQIIIVSGAIRQEAGNVIKNDGPGYDLAKLIEDYLIERGLKIDAYSRTSIMISLLDRLKKI